jgi:predicted RNA-binding protein Jag
VGFPAGLSINDSGVISGTPTENGDFSGIVVYSTPSDGDFKSAKVAVSINQAEIDETILLELITDRTLKDITDVRLLMQSGMTVEGISVLFANSKGSYNMSDMNRVSDATKWLAGYLKQLSIDIKAYLNNLHVSMSEKLDPKIDESIADIAMNSWGRSEKPTAAQLKTYLETITRVVNQMEQTWKLPSTMNKLTYTGANQIEQAILDEHEYSIKRKAEIYDLADRLASVVIYSDMITANEMEGYY